MFSSWAGGNGTTSEKVPSELIYDDENVTASEQANKRSFSGTPIPSPGASRPLNRIKWGYQVKPEQTPLRYLKLLLDPRQELPNYVDRADLLFQLRKCNRTSIEAVSDLLAELFKEAKNAVLKRYGPNMVQTTKVDFVLTVPAVWSDTAKDATLKAAERAGLVSDLHMISEPEAAAIYSLKSMENHGFDVGDNFIVCDAGGGTVDLISYEIVSLKPLHLEESIRGTGGLCGAAFLNMRFQQLVEKRMGARAYKDLAPQSFAVLMKNFEDYVKRNFEALGSAEEFDDGEFNVPFPGVPDNQDAGIKMGFFSLSHPEVAEIFRPIINQIIKLVEEQRNSISSRGKAAKGVILVGGLGQSRHLFQELKIRFADDDPPPSYSEATGIDLLSNAVSRLTVMQPANPWTAVVRGAVISGLEGRNLVRSRVARRHYGVLCTEAWDEDLHSAHNKFWSDTTEEFLANNQIEWHVKKGDALPSGAPILLPFTQDRKGHSPQRTIETELIVSDEEEAPDEFNASLQTRVLCRFDVSLRDISNSRWKTRRTATGKTYRTLEHEIGMQVQSGGIVFDFRVGGQVFGTIRAEFE